MKIITIYLYGTVHTNKVIIYVNSNYLKDANLSKFFQQVASKLMFLVAEMSGVKFLNSIWFTADKCDKKSILAYGTYKWRMYLFNMGYTRYWRGVDTLGTLHGVGLACSSKLVNGDTDNSLMLSL